MHSERSRFRRGRAFRCDILIGPSNLLEPPAVFFAVAKIHEFQKSLLDCCRRWSVIRSLRGTDEATANGSDEARNAQEFALGNWLSGIEPHF